MKSPIVRRFALPLFAILLATPSIALALNGNTFLGDGAGVSNTTGTENTFIGENAGNANTIGLQNTLIGNKAGENNTTGSINIFIGSRTGNQNTSGQNNVFIGNQGGRFNTTGGQNTFLGSSAGLNNTTANSNVFLGYETGRSNTTGGENTFIGTGAGNSNTVGQFNVFVGQSSGRDNTSGNDNTFVGQAAGTFSSTGTRNALFGYHAGVNIKEGSNNSFFGADSGEANDGGSNNVFIGTQAGRRSIGSSNNIFVGYQAGYNEINSNKLYIENSDSSTPLIYGDFATDEVTINSILKTTTLCLSGDCRTEWPDGSGGSGSELWSELDGNVFRSTGFVGVGTNSPNHIFDVITPTTNKFYINNQGADFSSYESAFEGIDGETALNSFAQTGSSFSLAAIANAFPNAVETENDLSYVDYEQLVPHLIEAIKAQNIRIDELEARIDDIVVGNPSSVTIQAENANTIAGGVTVDNNNAGFNGTGFTNFPINNGYIEFRNVEGRAGGNATLRIRRALGVGNRTGSITINGITQAYTCSSTGSWTNYATTDLAVTLNPGTTNTIRFSSTGADFCNVDEVTILY